MYAYPISRLAMPGDRPNTGLLPVLSHHHDVAPVYRRSPPPHPTPAHPAGRGPAQKRRRGHGGYNPQNKHKGHPPRERPRNPPRGTPPKLQRRGKNPPPPPLGRPNPHAREHPPNPPSPPPPRHDEHQ